LVKLPNKAILQPVPSSLDATCLVEAIEPGDSTPDARGVRMALDSERHYHARTWQVHRFSGTPSRTRGSSDRGWHRIAYGSRRSGPSTGSANIRWVLIHFEWRKVTPQVRLKALVSWLVAIGLIATRYVTHVYLRASWTKANLPRGRSAKPKGLSKEKVAGSPKGDY
jgi:hypothetical protein